MNWFRLKTCIKCQGDLAADNGDWLCLQCGTYYYTGLYQLHPHFDDGPQVSKTNVSEQPRKKLLGVVTVPLFPALQSPAPGCRSPISPGPISIVVAAMAAAAAL